MILEKFYQALWILVRPGREQSGRIPGFVAEAPLQVSRGISGLPPAMEDFVENRPIGAVVEIELTTTEPRGDFGQRQGIR